MIPRRAHRSGWTVFEAVKHADERGWLAETFLADVLCARAGNDVRIVQQNLSASRRGVLRGLHYQVIQPQGKLVLVVQGQIFDAIVDLRRDSPDFGRSFLFELAANDLSLLWVPPGFAHGFLARSDALVCYALTQARLPEAERALRWNCPRLGIDWPLTGIGAPILSARDRNAPGLADAETFAGAVAAGASADPVDPGRNR